MIPGMFTEPAGKGGVKCKLCPHFCVLKDGQTGKCNVRKNLDGSVYSLNSDRVAALHSDPIEKKPLYHFLPGSSSLSLAAMGCNLKCRFCQNHTISIIEDETKITGDTISPDDLVQAAIRAGASSISYTYTEPTIYFELMYETAKAAKGAGLKNVMVSNGFISEEALKKIIPFMDGANIDLKSFSEKFYSEQCGGRLGPVLDSIRLINRSECWLELTTLLIPELNTGMEEIRELVSFITETGPEIPWHVSRFFPHYRTEDKGPTDTELINKVLEFAENSGIRFVYGGNFESDRWENTRCPGCEVTLIKRSGYEIRQTDLNAGRCGRCDTEIQGVWN